MTTSEWRRGGYVVSTDPARVDLGIVHTFLAEESYWARDRCVDVVRRSIVGSLPFGLYHERSSAQVGFARVVTDGETFGWVCDVFVDAGHRGQGLGVWLMACVVERCRGVGRLVLATRDAHGVYEHAGFVPLAHPERWMQLENPSLPC